MGEKLYTKKYYEQIQKLVDKHPHRCRDCNVADGWRRINRDGSMQKFPAIVRLALVEPKSPGYEVSNVGMFCTRCRKPDQVWKTPRRIKPQHLPQLFEAKS